MDFDDKRTLFWKKFIRYANIQPNSSVGDEIDLEAFSRDHAIQIFAKNDFRLMVGVNRTYFRCSLHLTGENISKFSPKIKKDNNEFVKMIRFSRDPVFRIKENDSSIVLMLRDYGFIFPPKNNYEGKVSIEWLYRNATVFNNYMEKLI